ncbi:MAG: hypothetical protein U0Q12_16735 [Vicinamibacterales bacterium]
MALSRWTLAVALVTLSAGDHSPLRAGSTDTVGQGASAQPRPETVKPADLPRFPEFVGGVVSAQRKGDRILICADQAISPFGGSVRKLDHPQLFLLNREILEEVRGQPGLCHGAWSPTADEFAAISPAGVWLFHVPLDPGRLVRTATLNDRGTVAYVTGRPPKWAPNGRLLALAVTRHAGGSPDVVDTIEVIDAASGALVLATPMHQDFEWTPDSGALRVGKSLVKLPAR